MGAADPAIRPDSAPFLLLLLLRRAEAACGDGGEGAGVRGGVWCDAPVSFVGGGQGVPYEFGAWRGVKMQLHFHSFRPILPRSPSLWCPRGSHLPPSRAASTASARPYALTYIATVIVPELMRPAYLTAAPCIVGGESRACYLAQNNPDFYGRPKIIAALHVTGPTHDSCY